MTSHEFWQIIAQAKKNALQVEARPDTLRKLLLTHSAFAVQSLHEIYQKQSRLAYQWDLWAAVYIINDGCSDECFDFFRDWLISEGQETFEKALVDAQSLAELDKIELCELEELGYVAGEVFSQLSGQPMPLEQFEHTVHPSGKPWDEDSLERRYPKLTAKYCYTRCDGCLQPISVNTAQPVHIHRTTTGQPPIGPAKVRCYTRLNP